MTDIASLRRELLHRRLATAAGRPASRDIERRSTLEASLSHAQERLWFLEQLGVVGGSYNIGLAVRLVGRLDAAALAAALSEVVRRHEARRTRFASRDEAAVQVIDPPWPVTLEPLAVAPDEAGEQACAILQQRFDLAHDRLLRVALLRLAADQHVLVLAMHHIVSDGWSIGVLVREVEALYAAFAQGRPSPCGTHPRRARGPDRLLHHPAGAAHPSRRRRLVPLRAARREGRRAGRLCPSGSAVREAGRGAASRP